MDFLSFLALWRIANHAGTSIKKLSACLGSGPGLFSKNSFAGIHFALSDCFRGC
jgi:hypothetical protein